MFQYWENVVVVYINSQSVKPYKHFICIQEHMHLIHKLLKLHNTHFTGTRLKEQVLVRSSQQTTECN